MTFTKFKIIYLSILRENIRMNIAKWESARESCFLNIVLIVY